MIKFIVITISVTFLINPGAHSFRPGKLIVPNSICDYPKLPRHLEFWLFSSESERLQSYQAFLESLRSGKLR